jgi:hypothetical protein
VTERSTPAVAIKGSRGCTRAELTIVWAPVTEGRLADKEMGRESTKNALLTLKTEERLIEMIWEDDIRVSIQREADFCPIYSLERLRAGCTSI